MRILRLPCIVAFFALAAAACAVKLTIVVPGVSIGETPLHALKLPYHGAPRLIKLSLSSDAHPSGTIILTTTRENTNAGMIEIRQSPQGKPLALPARFLPGDFPLSLYLVGTKKSHQPRDLHFIVAYQPPSSASSPERLLGADELVTDGSTEEKVDITVGATEYFSPTPPFYLQQGTSAAWTPTASLFNTGDTVSYTVEYPGCYYAYLTGLQSDDPANSFRLYGEYVSDVTVDLLVNGVLEETMLIHIVNLGLSLGLSLGSSPSAWVSTTTAAPLSPPMRRKMSRTLSPCHGHRRCRHMVQHRSRYWMARLRLLPARRRGISMIPRRR